MQHKQRTPWESLDAFPPPYCRLLAKNKGSGRSGNMAVTDAELAIKSGIPLARVIAISRSENWSAVTTGEMRRFFEACNFDPTNALHRQRVKQYERVCTQRKTTPFLYLRNSPRWESEFLPMYLIASKIMDSKSAPLKQEMAG